MRYQIQWFPYNAKYNEKTFLAAVSNQPTVTNAKLVPYVNRYNPSIKVDHPHAIEFTIPEGYESTRTVVSGINDYLMKKSRTSIPQKLSIRAIATEFQERKHKKSKPKIKKCGCK
jgi:hypothetical protein